jgi:hypothetical protein
MSRGVLDSFSFLFPFFFSSGFFAPFGQMFCLVKGRAVRVVQGRHYRCKLWAGYRLGGMTLGDDARCTLGKFEFTLYQAYNFKNLSRERIEKEGNMRSQVCRHFT